MKFPIYTMFISRWNYCSAFLDKDLEVGESNPNVNLKRVMFKNFINISSFVTIEEGVLTLEKEVQ